jgi:hypothetical protein
MRTSNLANQAVRQAEVGHVWEEVTTNGSGTIEVLKYSTFRVRAAAAVTVSIDGILAATMVAGEILVFNAGGGAGTDAANLVPSVPVVITGTAFVQVARSTDRKP